MHVVHRILRLMFASAAWALAIAGLWFGVQMLIWWNIPPISEVSIVYACAPHHAIRNSAYLFALVFGIVFVVRIPEYVVRPWLFDEDKPPSGNEHSVEN